MKNGKVVLLTGAGGAAIPYLIERLKKRGYTVYGADMDPYASGLYLAHKGFVIPAGGSPEWVARLKTICAQEQIDAIIPLVDKELLNSFVLEKLGVTAILPKPSFVKLCLDKYSCMKALSKFGISAPQSRLLKDGLRGLDFPLVIKPRSSAGSRGFKILNSNHDFKNYMDSCDYRKNDLVLQRFIEGVEFTVSVMTWRQGPIQAIVPKEIILKKGITRLAVTRKNESIERLCRKIHEHFSPEGPFNVQLIVEKASGLPQIIEINPRFSSSVSLTIEAGVDEVGEILDQQLLSKPAKMHPDWKQGVMLIRQSEECFSDEKSWICKRPFMDRQR